MDNFYRIDLPHDGTTNWDHPDSFDHKLFIQFLNDLNLNESAEYPEYDFATSSRKKDTANQTKPKTKLFIFEGIFAHHEPIAHLYQAKIFVDTDSAICFERRKIRDVAERNFTEEQVISWWNKSVFPMYQEHILPKKDLAHIVLTNDNEHSENLNFDMSLLIENLNKLLINENKTTHAQIRYILMPPVPPICSQEALPASAPGLNISKQ